MAWRVRYGEGDASGFPPRYASTARAGSAIGASAYFLREDDRRRGSSYARPDPTGHVIAKQARRAFEASRGEDAVGESVRYVRSLRYLPRERGEDQHAVVSGEANVSSSSNATSDRSSSNEPSDSGGHRGTGVSSFGFGYPTGDGGVGAFEFPATRSVMWDPSAIGETTHISAAAHVATASLGAGASKSLAELLLREKTETEPVTVEDDLKVSRESIRIAAKGALVASRRVLDRRGEFRASAALEIFAVGDGKAFSARDAETEFRSTEPESDDGVSVRSEAWSSAVAVAIASAPFSSSSSTREALEAMTSFPSENENENENENERLLEDEETLAEKRRVSALAPLRVATPWRARLAATVVKKEDKNDDEIELIVSARVRVPTAVFAATPIAPPRVAAQTRAPRAPIGSGFLTMDRTRRLMLLDETDPASLALPTVGVWVSGVTHVTHLAVWAACHRYVTSDALKDKATQRGAFLCLLFPPAPELSEAEVSKSLTTKVSRMARAPPPTCHDVRLVEPRGASPRTHADFAATFECVPGETSVRARLAPPPAMRAERNADKSVFDGVSRDEAEAEASADASDSSRVTLRRRASSSSADAAASASASRPVEQKEKDASLSLSTPKPSSSRELGSMKRESASPDWAPVYGAAPRTAYEAAAAAAAARAAAANAKLAASRGSTPSSLLSPAKLSPVKPRGAPAPYVGSSSFPLEGAARVVVEEQQRVIAELRAAVAFLETEMAQLTRPISAREREAQARDLLGGLEGASGFEPRGDADDADGDKGAFFSSPARPSSKSPLRKALAFARGGEERSNEADAALSASFRSDEVDAMYGMDTPEGSGDEKTRRESGRAAKETKASKKAAREERRAARREKKAKKKSESGGDGDESLLFPRQRADEGEEEAEEAAEEEEEEEDGVREASKKDAAAADAADAAEARALAHRDAATASFAATRALFPAAPDGIPPEFPEPPSSFMPSQPARRFCESPYVESAEEAREKGERVADPLPGGGARYPAEPHLAHAATGYAFADDASEEDASDTDALLNASSFMVDPEAMDEETAARRAATTRRDAALRLISEEPSVAPTFLSGEGESAESDARRATVRAGLDPMYPVIDCSFGDEGADDEDERVEELLEKYGAAAGRDRVKIVAEGDDDGDDAT